MVPGPKQQNTAPQNVRKQVVTALSYSNDGNFVITLATHGGKFKYQRNNENSFKSYRSEECKT